ncbi:MAG: porin [bacterium]|nr:porin [bacterium]
MKNLLITLMVMLIASAAFAGGDGMNWKFYGRLHTSIDYMSDGGDEKSFTMSSNTSRFGFKGGTELNENLGLIWQFENSFNSANGTGTISNRNTYVGLKGEFGQFRFGRHDTPFKTLGRKVDFFKDELGDFRSMTMGWDRRETDLIAWISPNWDGFGIFAAFQMDQADLADDAMTAYSAMAHYKKDEFFFGAAIEGMSEAHAAANPDPTLDPDDGAVYGDAPMGIRVAAKYSAEQFAISALFQTLTNWTGMWVDPGGGDDWTYEGLDATSMGVGAVFHANETTDIKASYFMMNHDTDAEDVDGTDEDESDTVASQFALGIDKKMAKNVTFYVQVVMVMNGDWTGSGLGGPVDEDALPNIERAYGNGHGTWMGPGIDDDGNAENPMGFSLGTKINF